MLTDCSRVYSAAVRLDFRNILLIYRKFEGVVDVRIKELTASVIFTLQLPPYICIEKSPLKRCNQ